MVTFTQAGISSDAGSSNTVLTVGSTNYAYNALPSNLWVGSGTTFSWSSPVAGSSGERFVYVSDSGLTSPITASGTDAATYKTQYQVTFVATPSAGGSVSPSGTSVWESTGSLSITATSNSGYSFSSWSSTAGTVANTGLSQTSVTISASGTVSASFSQNTYTVTVNVDPSSAAGMVTGYVTTQTYHYGDSVTLSESPNDGYTFSSWGGDGSGTGTTCGITVTGNMVVSASFSQNTYTVTVNVDPSSAAGMVTGYVTTQTYHYGDSVTLSESPNDGYTFSSWGGDGSGTGTTCGITVTGNMVVSASFSQNTYTVTVNVDPSSAAGMVTGYVTTQTYHYGDSVTLSESPNDGYTFSSWGGDGSGTGTTCGITVTGNMVVSASFSQNIIPTSLTVASDPEKLGTNGGTIKVTVNLMDSNKQGVGGKTVDVCCTLSVGGQLIIKIDNRHRWNGIDNLDRTGRTNKRSILRDNSKFCGRQSILQLQRGNKEWCRRRRLNGTSRIHPGQPRRSRRMLRGVPLPQTQKPTSHKNPQIEDAKQRIESSTFFCINRQENGV